MNIFGSQPGGGDGAAFGGSEVVGQDATLGTSNNVPLWLISGGNKRIKLNNEEPVTVLDQGVGGIGLNATKVTLAQDPTGALEAATKQYVDAQAAQNIFDQPLNTTDDVLFNKATVTTDVQVNGDITVQGNVQVFGTTTTLNTLNLEVKDKQILLNDGEPGAGVSNGFGQAGILIDRGTENDVEMVYDDADDDTWKFRNAVTGALSNVDTGNLDINGTLTTSGTSTLNSCVKINCSNEDDGLVIRRTGFQDSGILFQNSGNSYTQRLRHTGPSTLELQSGINTTPDNLTTILSVEGTNSALLKNWKHANDGTAVGLTLQTLDNLNPTGLAFQNGGASYTSAIQRENVDGVNADLVIRCGLNADPLSLPEAMRINNGQVTIVPDLNVVGDGKLASVDTVELKNTNTVNGVPVSNTQWGYLGAMNQSVASSDNVVFASVDVGTLKRTAVNWIPSDTTPRFTLPADRLLNVRNSGTLTANVVYIEMPVYPTGTICHVITEHNASSHALRLVKDPLGDNIIEVFRDGSFKSYSSDSVYYEMKRFTCVKIQYYEFGRIGITECLRKTDTELSQAQWGYLSNMDQPLATSDNVGFVSVDTAELKDTNIVNSVPISNDQWGYLGAMNQSVASTDDVTFNTIAATNGLTSFGNFNAQGTGFTVDPATQTQMKGRIISTTQWDYLGTQDQPVDTFANVTFNNITATGLLTAAQARLQSHMNGNVTKPPGGDGLGQITTSGGAEFELIYSGGNTVSGSVNPYIGLGPETNLPDFQFSVIKIDKNITAPPGIPVQDFSDTYYTPSTIVYVGAFTKTFDAEYRFALTSNTAGSGRFVVKLDRQDTFGPQEIPTTVIDQPLLNGAPTVYHAKFRLYSLAPTSRLTFHFQTASNETFTLDEVQFSFTQLLI